ncbi:winged helix DNA-binding domain-containing protein [Nocardia sp. 348MFTsu5.1]|uniref:winged helix DNA-binding domain-containing protein n=1 Tax=Nocardia sp. 348MFTsu5.1 TaxID=1172185 RepID=UPI000364321C|nr:winged helix DNA-binding domain-containing protein [Nocardia sp. 348MFTsu5.1]
MSRPAISTEQRRARLLRRHRLVADEYADTPEQVAEAVVGLHATTPSTVFLSAWARMEAFEVADLERALYTDRTLVKQLAMRRTLFVFPRPALADAVSAVGPRVAASERTNMLRDLRRSEDFPDPEGWIEKARAAVAGALIGGRSASSSELRQELPELSGSIRHGEGKSWGGVSSMGPRVLSHMCASGAIVRGPNDGNWLRSRPRWTSMSDWLGAPLELTDVAGGHRALIERWLRRFGPGTETDIVWWLGSTKTAVRKALSELEVVEVDLDDESVGYVMADDLEPLEPAPPTALLLPELDPTLMGWKQRDWYLGPHGSHLFDSNGNGGQTVWWDGRAVGGWYQRADGSVGVHMLEKVARPAVKAIRERADELSSWLGDARPKPGYPAPFHKVLPGG